MLFNNPPPPEIYTCFPTLSLHDALPIFGLAGDVIVGDAPVGKGRAGRRRAEHGCDLSFRGLADHDLLELFLIDTGAAVIIPRGTGCIEQQKESGGDHRARMAHRHGRRLAITRGAYRSEEHTSELQSLMRISYAVFCLKKKNKNKKKQ